MTVIRKAELRDSKDIQHIAKVTWNATYEGLIQEEVQTNFLNMAYSDEMMIRRVEKTALYVAEMDKRAVGFANFSNVDPQTGSAELAAIYLLPDYQNRGLGTLLLEKGLRDLSDASVLYVHVEKDNESGKRFYEAKGFTLVDEFTEDFNGHPLRTLKLALDL